MKLTLKCSWESLGAVTSAAGSWRRPGGDLWGKTPDNFLSFYIWRSNKWLKIEESLQINLF